MRTRIAASAILAAGILLGTTSCGLLAPQATKIQYDSSDGVSGAVGEIDIRNAILLSEDGKEASLLVTLVNQGTSPHVVTMQYVADGGKVNRSVVVKASESVTVGTPDAPSVILKDLDTRPGALFPLYFQYGNEPGDELLVPVLDGSQPEYSTLLPDEKKSH